MRTRSKRPDSIGGGASESVARATAVEALPTVPPADADEWLAGIAQVLDFVRKWLRAHPGPRSATPAAFVFPAYPGRVQQDLRATRRRGFRNAEATESIQGNVYIGPETLNDVGVVAGVAPDVPTVLQYLVDSQLGESPAVVLLPASDEVILCPAGAANEAVHERLSLLGDSRGVTVASLDDLLDRFHRAWLMMPSDHTRVWADKNRFIPVRSTEKVIHNYLYPFLMAAFDDTHLVRSEDRTFAGRADITITKREGRPSEGSGVLELKVLRAMRHPESGGAAVQCPMSVNEQAVADGITQALFYKNSLGCELAFVCLYDLRRDDDPAIVEAYKQDFDANGVLPRRYFLYNSSRAYRRAQEGAVSRRGRRRGSADAATTHPTSSGISRVAERPAKRSPRKKRGS